MKTKILSNPSPFETDVKRFYVPGARLETECPKCNAAYVRDFGKDCLSYPKANEAFELHLYCDCGHEWSVSIRVAIGVEIADAEKPARQP